MPAELFVDSEEENNSEAGDDDSGDEHEEHDGNDDVDEGSTEQNGRKRKGMNKRGEAKRNKKLRKLGPKGEKGQRNKGELTKEEIKELTEKEYTYYSNLYNVQLEEVLKECGVSVQAGEKVDEWLEKLRNFLEGQKKCKSFGLGTCPKMLKGIEVPLPKSVFSWQSGGKWKDIQLTWLPPTCIGILGSWTNHSQLDKVSSVDVFLEMPSQYLHKSDYLNHKYHVKRAIYLTLVAKKLQARGDTVKWSLLNGDPLRPVILVELDEITFCIRAVPPEDFFKLGKLSFDRNNLRYEHFFKKPKSEDDPEPSTQHYNSSILEDALASELNEDVNTFLSTDPSLTSSLKLVKVWLAQRGLSQGYGAFTGFVAAQFLQHLYMRNQVSESMSVLQILRTYFANLIWLDLTEQGVSLSGEQEHILLAQLQYDVVLLDKSGKLNICANISKYTYKRIQEEARQALRIIEQRNVTGFLALFTTPVKFSMNFDHVISLIPKRLGAALNQKSELESMLLDHSGFIYPVAVSVVCSLVEKTLRDRKTFLDCQLPESPVWGMSSTPPNTLLPSYIRLGLLINRSCSESLVAKWESDSPMNIEQFREFWGDKCELRRFKDGTITESVALDNISHQGTSRVCYQMIHYILQHHLNYTLGENSYIDRQLETMMESKYIKVKPAIVEKVKKSMPTNGSKGVFLKGKLVKKKFMKTKILRAEETQSVSIDEVSKQAVQTFDELSKMLRQIEELPLQISTVQSTSSVLRFCHVKPAPPQSVAVNKTITVQRPNVKALRIKVETERMEIDDDNEDQEIVPITTKLPAKLPKYVDPIGVVIHLESSGQWPDNMEAIERLKCAFLIKIGELLQAKFGLTVHPYAKFLDVLKGGFLFRMKITYLRELTLLKQLRGNDGVLKVRDSSESQRLEREALVLPQLTSTLHAFHLQYEAFGKTCRLAKRWVASQLLLASPWEYNSNLDEPDCRLTEESVELLVAYTFLNPAPHMKHPSEAQVGFQRFLYLLAKTDFHSVPIIVNFNDKWTAEEVAHQELEFVKIRPTLPCIFIATPFDEKGSVWTRNLLGVLLKRLRRLADVALCILDNQFQEDRAIQSNTGLKTIFQPVTRDMDLVIRLNPKLNPRSFQAVESVDSPWEFRAYKPEANEVFPITDFDPVQMFLQEIRDAFGHLAVFLHDTYGGNMIAVKWKPAVFKPSPFSTAAVKGRWICKENPNAITTNVNAVLESLEVMGNGLIEKIETFPDRWEIE